MYTFFCLGVIFLLRMVLFWMLGCKYVVIVVIFLLVYPTQQIYTKSTIYNYVTNHYTNQQSPNEFQCNNNSRSNGTPYDVQALIRSQVKWPDCHRVMANCGGFKAVNIEWYDYGPTERHWLMGAGVGRDR